MESFYFNNTKEIKNEKANLENKLNVKITLTGKNVKIEGTPYEEYEASIVFDAMSFGFTSKKAITLKESDTLFRKLNIKDFTRRKNLYEVRSRIIGKEGKTKRTIEEISGCEIVIKDNSVGIIGSSESIELAVTALKNLIKGTKQANVYRFLERTNKTKNVDDLGIKYKKE